MYRKTPFTSGQMSNLEFLGEKLKNGGELQRDAASFESWGGLKSTPCAELHPKGAETREKNSRKHRGKKKWKEQVIVISTEEVGNGWTFLSPSMEQVKKASLGRWIRRRGTNWGCRGEG